MPPAEYEDRDPVPARGRLDEGLVEPTDHALDEPVPTGTDEEAVGKLLSMVGEEATEPVPHAQAEVCHLFGTGSATAEVIPNKAAAMKDKDACMMEDDISVLPLERSYNDSQTMKWKGSMITIRYQASVYVQRKESSLYLWKRKRLEMNYFEVTCKMWSYL